MTPNRTASIRTSVVALVFGGLAIAGISGCSDTSMSGNPPRESISVPRSSGGQMDAVEKKGAAAKNAR